MAKSEIRYDSMGRAYQSIVYNPDCQTFFALTESFADPLGQVVKVIDPDTHVVEYTYDKAGRNTVVYFYGEPAWTYYTYDPAGRLVLVSNDQRVAGRYELTVNYFDRNGNTTATAFWGTHTPSGWTWPPIMSTTPLPWNYDKIPTTSGVSDDNHLVTTFAYGADSTYGSYVAAADPKGVMSFTYADRLGRPTRSVEAKDGIDRMTLFSYDLPVEGKGYNEDRIIAKNEPANDQTTKYRRGDPLNASRVTETVYPDTGKVTAIYSADGTVKSRTDQRLWTTTYTYDALACLTQEDVSKAIPAAPDLVGTHRAARAYDALGRVTELCDYYSPDAYNDNSVVKTAYAYQWSATSSDQTVTESTYIDNALMGSVTSVIEHNSRRKSLTYPNGRNISFGYDMRNRVTSIVESGVSLAGYEYQNDYLQWLYINNMAVRAYANFHDAFGRQTQFDYMFPTVFASLGYGYDRDSNPLYQQDLVTAANSELYVYDSLNRLVDMKRGTLNTQKTDIPSPSFRQTWSLDKQGNWPSLNDNGTADVRQHSEANEIALPSGGFGQIRTYGGAPREITHDAAGNIATCQSNDGSTTQRYSYDYKNRLIKVESKTTGSYSTVVNYLFDALNRRVKKVVVGGADVVYNYDGWRCTEEKEVNGSVWLAKRQYVFGGRYLDEPLIFDIDTNGNGNCTDAGGSTRYLYCQNANWNVCALTDANGAVVERMIYSAYGEPVCTRISDNHTQAASHFGNPWLFQGQRFDSETGLYHFKNRTYEAVLGRFNERDPWHYKPGASSYLAFEDSPVGFGDSQGLKAEQNTCCCCVDSLGIKKNRDIRVSNVLTTIPIDPKDPKKGVEFTLGSEFGHDFTATAKYSYLDAKGEVKTDCTEEWNEKIDKPLSREDYAKLYPGQVPENWNPPIADKWYNTEEFPFKTDTRKMWEKCPKGPRPGGPYACDLSDRPRMGWAGNLDFTRKLEFDIVVKSSTDERCKHVCKQPDVLHAKAEQKIVIRRGVVDEAASYFLIK